MHSISEREQIVPYSHLYLNAKRFLKDIAPTEAILEKKENRRRALGENPLLHRFVNTARLREIIDYEVFNCSPYSSVALNEAVEGSDIDGGVVVSSLPSTVDHQMLFIAELRTQGFGVAHRSEVEELEKQLAELEERIQWDLVVDEDPLFNTYCEIMSQFAQCEAISFYSKAQMEERMNKVNRKRRLTWDDADIAIYLAGASVPDNKFFYQNENSSN